MEHYEEDYEITLAELFDILKKRALMIVGMTLTTAVIAAIVSIFVLTPKFETSTTMLVNYKQNQETTFSSGDLTMSRQLAGSNISILCAGGFSPNPA